MLVVPLQPVPRQSLQVQLAAQATTLVVYQVAYGLFVDVYLGGALIAGGVLCENLNRILRSPYLDFVGDLLFVDTSGEDDPNFTGLGGRFQLVYIEASDNIPGVSS